MLLAAFAVFFMRDLLAYRKAFLHPDFYTLYYPFRHWFSLRLAGGELPLWNPYWGIGHAADAWGTIPLDFYTPLEFLVGPRYVWFQLLQAMGVLGAAAYALRRFGFPLLLSAGGALLFFLSPWVSYFFLYFILPHSFIAHVLLFLFAYLWIETRDRRYLVGIACTTAVGMLGTKLDFWMVQSAHFTLLVAGGALLVHGRRVDEAARAAGAAVLATALGVAANAWQLTLLLPTLAESGRTEGSGFAALLSGRLYRNLALSLPESVLVELALVAALLYGALGARRLRWALVLVAAATVAIAMFLSFDKRDLPREPVADSHAAVTAGRAPEIAPSSRDGTFAGFWAQFASGPVALGALIAFAVSVLGLGDRDWRAPARTSLLFLLFAYYYCRYTRGDLGEVQILHSAPAAFRLGLAAFVWLGCRQLAENRLARLAYLSALCVFALRDQGGIILAHVTGAQWVPTRDNFIVDWAFAVLAVVGLGSLGQATASLRGGLWRRWAAVAALAVVGATVVAVRGDLLYVHPLVGPAPPGYPYFDGIPSVRALLASLRDGPTTRVFVANDEFMEFHHVMGSSVLEGVGQVSLYASLGSARYRDWTVLQRLGIRPEQHWRGWSNETTAGTVRRLPRVRDLGFPQSKIYKYTIVSRPALARDALELLGVRYVLRLYPVEGAYRVEDRPPDPVEDAVRRLEPVRVRLISGHVLGEAPKPMYLAQPSHPLPRAFILGVPDATADVQLRSVVTPRVEAGALAIGATRWPVTPAKITRYEPERVEVETNGTTGGILVLSDLFHPFWRASVDGRPTEIIPVFSVLRGVRVDAGPHAVTFTCHVPHLKPAWVVSAVAVLLIAAGWIGTRRGAAALGGRAAG